MPNQERLLRAAFLTGAITDALALLSLLIPPLAGLLWGFDDSSGGYRFAMGYAASLMLGWTVLLIWAFRSPIERRVVAATTFVVVCGLVLTEIVGLCFGYLAVWRFLPTLCLQAVLLSLFAAAFHSGKAVRSAGAQGLRCGDSETGDKTSFEGH
jgi:hypothetical protein